MIYDGTEIFNNGIHNYNLKTFTWKLIDICNQRCEYCNEGFGSDKFRPKSSFFQTESQINSYKSVLKILRLKSIGNFEVDLIGGEPTLHPYIYDIIEHLTVIDNCKEISVLTNLKKSFSFYEKFNDIKYNKLLLCPSIHFDYYTPDLLIKCIEINKFEHTKILPIIMLHDNEKHWNNMEIFINTLIQHDVPYTISFINSCYDYTVNYTKNFYLKFNKFIMRDDNKYAFNNTLLLDKYDIYLNKLNTFKGWKCKPLRYIIKHTGEIINACTEKPMSFIDADKFVTCPNTECNCDIQWNYEKYKI
jgi:organic radical activating enzyme